jgi:uncharacterized membrane protein
MSQTTGKTTTGMQPNVEGLLCYLLTWVTGIVFFIIEKENKTVRFHALQSILVFAPINIIQFILAFIPIIGWIINILLWVLELILWIFLMYNAYQGKMIKIPIAGNIAEKNSNPPPAPQVPPQAPPTAPK